MSQSSTPSETLLITNQVQCLEVKGTSKGVNVQGQLSVQGQLQGD